MRDLIYRQDAVKMMYDACQDIDVESLHIDVIVDVLENLPSAEPERKTGKWNQIISIPNDMYGRYYCSECGKEGNTFWNFCPNCGSYNGGEQDG